MRQIEYRVSWVMWPPHFPKPHRAARSTYDEDSAKSQYDGLRSMLAGHALQPCAHSVWEPRLEKRTVDFGEWILLEKIEAEVEGSRCEFCSEGNDFEPCDSVGPSHDGVCRLCMRAKGHEGEHIACCGVMGHDVERWTDDLEEDGNGI